VYLSRDVWDGEHKEAVLAHELEHARRQDPFWLFIARGVRRSTFFLPWGDQMLRDLTFESERACDAAGIRAVKAKRYGRALHDFSEQVSDHLHLNRKPVPTALPFFVCEAISLIVLFTAVSQLRLTRSPAYFIERRLDLLIKEAVIGTRGEKENLALFWIALGWVCSTLLVIH